MEIDTLFIVNLIDWMQTFSSEFLSIINLLILCAFLLFAFKRFGLTGLYIYSALAVLISNIQVLRGSYFFSLTTEPVALGTIPFATIFLCNDIITEHYGRHAAFKSVWIGFFAQIFFTFTMVLSLGYPQTPGIPDMHQHYQEMVGLFLPAPRLLLASLVSFMVSQWLDIGIFSKIRLITHGRFLWLRTIVSGSVASLIDNALFSVLAWVAFSPHPVSTSDLIYTYILGTYVSRLVVSVISYPVLNASYFFKPKSQSE